MSIADIVRREAERAAAAAPALAIASGRERNEMLQALIASLSAEHDAILEANERDMQAGREKGLTPSLLDRLQLTPSRLDAIAQAILELIALPDPLGEIISGWQRPNGLQIAQVRVPLGVVGMIYEARPNVTVDAAAICLKTGNAVVLKGGKEALNSNRALVAAMQKGLAQAGFNPQAIAFIDSPEREAGVLLGRSRGLVDVIIPRGGAGLIQAVVETCSVPVIETGAGVCHLYLHADAPLEMSRAIALNAKVQRPSVCNAIETLLVHSGAAWLLPDLLASLQAAEVSIRGCKKTRDFFPEASLAEPSDWSTEYLDLTLSVKVVEDLDEAIAHIRRYGTKHSEAIITHDLRAAQYFTRSIDAAAVYVNASTRFTDGGEFGFGAEIGISTQKLHARGPMGLHALTSSKYVIHGEGQVRG